MNSSSGTRLVNVTVYSDDVPLVISGTIKDVSLISGRRYRLILSFSSNTIFSNFASISNLVIESK